jgi:DNA-binding ferritin-like protein (Dps family)
MRRVILHVGTEKTGSTYLQSVFARNQKLLKKYGILYPVSGIESGHHYWLAKAFGFRYQSKRICEDLEERALSNLRAELNNWPGDVLLSSEHFDINANKNSLMQLRDYFSGEQLEVVLVARNQVDYSQSLYAEGIKWTNVRSFGEFLDRTEKQERYSYLRRYMLWNEIGASFALVDYDANKRDLLVSFLEKANINIYAGEFSIPKSTQNVTPSIDFLEMVRLCNVNRDVDCRREFYLKCYKKIVKNAPDLMKKRHFCVPDNSLDIFRKAQIANNTLADILGVDKETFLGGSLIDRINKYADLPPPDPTIGMVRFIPLVLDM